jgi:cyclic pyranopterin phosphate synthase
MPHSAVLTFEEIEAVVRHAAANGVNKVRITGGEPLVRKNIVQLVAMLSAISGIHELTMTTNGVLLDGLAAELKHAGLQRINISLDTIDPQQFKEITRTGNIEDVFRGIEAARKAGLEPIKINCVIRQNPDEPNAKGVRAFCEKEHLQIRYIKEMNLDTGQFSQVIGGDGGQCSSCNRMRLTANGDLKPCLFSDLAYNIRSMGIENAWLAAIKNKPACGSVNHKNQFSNIGG